MIEVVVLIMDKAREIKPPKCGLKVAYFCFFLVFLSYFIEFETSFGGLISLV